MIRPKSAFPVFVVQRPDQAKSFYTRHFDFGVAFENEWYLHLVSDAGIQVGFMLPGQPTQPEIFHQAHGGAGVIFSLEVEDAESAYARAQEASLEVVLALRSEDWGQYHFCVKDPNGIYLDVVQAIEPTETYQEGYAAE